MPTTATAPTTDTDDTDTHTDTAATAATPRPPRRTGAEQKLWQALLDNPHSPSAVLSDAAGVGKSTAAKILARWTTEGLVSRDPVRDPASRSRPTDHWTISGPAADDPNSDPSSTDPAVDEPVTTEAASADETRSDSATASHTPDNTPEDDEPENAPTLDAATGGGRERGAMTNADAVAYVEAADDMDDDDAADADGDPDEAADDADDDADDDANGGADLVEVDAAASADDDPAAGVAEAQPLGRDESSVPSGGKDGHAAADAHEAVAVAAEAPAAVVVGRKADRLKPGDLRGLVEDFLRDHEGEHGPSAIGKALSRSSGAVANALEKLVESGYATRIGEKPKRYALATPAPDAAPADTVRADAVPGDGAADTADTTTSVASSTG